MQTRGASTSRLTSLLVHLGGLERTTAQPFFLAGNSEDRRGSAVHTEFDGEVEPRESPIEHRQEILRRHFRRQLSNPNDVTAPGPKCPTSGLNYQARTRRGTKVPTVRSQSALKVEEGAER
jgi:hypothetical protein